MPEVTADNIDMDLIYEEAHKENTVCFLCPRNSFCKYAWDYWNVWHKIPGYGDCLAFK